MYDPPDMRRLNDRLPETEAGSVPPSDAGSDMFFTAVAASRVPMIVTDPRRADNPIVFANEAFATLTGYARAEVVGRNCRFLQGPDTEADAVAALGRAMDERREVTIELLNYRKDGSSFWNALFLSPVHDHQGELVYFFGSQIDVSRRRDTEQALHEARTMEALGQLTGGIAHDFSNLLQVISGYSEILQALAADGSPDLERLGRASTALRTATDRAGELTRQLCAFSRTQRPEGRVIGVNALIESMSAAAAQTLGERVTWRTALAADLRTARIDPVQAASALLGILANAGEAMPEGGTVTVETANLGLRDREAALKRGVQIGDYVEVSVADTGIGMSADVLQHATEPFFTTKDCGRGLGLASVQAFAKRSGGAVRITSEPGRGTTVRLLFPAASPSRPHLSHGRTDGTGAETA